ncbi:hypothetical protein BH20BAC1_BH20BAC1_01020 [soil metagenome]
MELPENALTFEKTFFNRIFKLGDVKLSNLKDVLYTSMNSAKEELKAAKDRLQ